MKELSREERIHIEVNRLKDLYTEIEEDKYKLVEALIENQAFMTVILQDIQKDIKENGWSDTYKNGANQFGQKESASVSTYNKTIKNLSMVTKQLEGLLPKKAQEEVKKSKLDAFLEL